MTKISGTTGIVENVGAKWCHIEEWEGDYMNLCSAWSACTGFAGRLTTFLAETDPNVRCTSSV